MNNALFVIVSLVLWWIVLNTLRDFGVSWRTLHLLAGLWGAGAVSLWFTLA
jgi:hypothetical protein